MLPEPEYLIAKECPNIGKEPGDFYCNEYGTNYENLLAKGIIKENNPNEE